MTVMVPEPDDTRDNGGVTEMDDLIAFLRARLDEREAKAREAGIKVLDDDCQHLVTAPESLSWAVVQEGDSAYVQDATGTYVAMASEVHMLGEDWEAITAGRAEHMADNDPAWVLADVASKRKVIAEFLRCGPNTAGHPGLRGAVQYLAEAHDRHPAYREEWRP